MKQTLNGILAVCAVLTMGGALLTGCGSGPGKGTVITQSPTRDAPAELFGTWRLTSRSGGFTGGTFPAGSDPEVLTFDRNGTVFRSGGGQSPAQKTYRVTRRTTFLHTGTVLVLEYDNGSSPQIIEQADAQNLVLADEANDGFGSEYVRVSSGG